MEVKRLFDCIEEHSKRYKNPTLLNAKENGVWKAYSTDDVQSLSNKLCAGLLQCGISGNDMTVENADKIAIISNNRPEWIITDLAVQKTGAILVPIYPTTSAHELQFILNDALVKYIFVSSKDLFEKVQSIHHLVPSLKTIYTFNEIKNAHHWKELLVELTPDLQQKVQAFQASIPTEHVATIIYTSGTTGTPKGVMLTHKNIYSNAMLSKQSFPFGDDYNIKALSFLPLNHIFEKCITYIYLYIGNSVYYAESMETIGENLKEIKPDIFMTVPRLLEKVFERIMATGNALTGIKRKLFFWSITLGERYSDMQPGSLSYRLQLSVANKLVFSKWRQALGNNIDFIVTGGAACPPKLLRIFSAAQIPIYEGYGPTECSPVIAVNRRQPKYHNKFGTVGPIIDGIEVKLESDGEICVKGPTVMKGYYKRPDLTSETVIDGWLHTGDIGEWVDDSYLKITDRKKELFKTSGGKYVAPQPIENMMKTSPFIEQIMVVGADKKFVGALIVPAFPALKEWMKKNGQTFINNDDAVNNEKVKQLLRKAIDELNEKFNHVEQIKRFELLPNEWSIDGGELTPKMSMKRKVIMEKYKDAIDKIYLV